MAQLGLGRRVPTDFEHVERYPLTAAAVPSAPTPVVLGVNWYESFFEPVRVGGRWWIARGDNWGRVVGGHAICLKPVAVSDWTTWRRFYNQGTEGACVGFAWSRCMTLLNRRRYDARWLYRTAQVVDEWPGEGYDGTSVRAGGRVLIDEGHRLWVAGVSRPAELRHGIQVYRWARGVDDIVGVLAAGGIRSPYDEVGAVPFVNSWGTGYPWVVWIPYASVLRLLDEYGEAAIPTDR